MSGRSWQQASSTRSRAGYFGPGPGTNHSFATSAHPALAGGEAMSYHDQFLYHQSTMQNAFDLNSNYLEVGPPPYELALGQASQNWLRDTESGIDLPWLAHQPPPSSPHQHAYPSANGSLSATEYTPSGSSQEVNLVNSEESGRFPSQGSDFFCPASPTYAWSVPRMSQSPQESPRNSQGSWSSFSSPTSSVHNEYPNYTNPLVMNEAANLSQLFATEISERYEIYFSGSESGSSQSQPDMKRTRYDY